MEDKMEQLAEEAEVVGGTKEDKTIKLSDGTEVTIYRCKARYIGKVLGFIHKVFKELGVKSADGIPAVDLNNPTEMLKLFADSVDDVLPLAALMSSLSDEDVLDLELDDMVGVVLAVIEVNRDFFLKQILPKLPLGSLKAD